MGLRAPAAGIADSRHDARRSDRASAHRELYSEAFLIKRPLLQAIDPARTRPAVLLIDEIDRADEEFEGFLLELLAEFQITIPELGTLRAAEPPLVIVTSNRTREVHDALKRRCLYQWIEYPSFEKELDIVRARAPGGLRAAGGTGHRHGAGAAACRTVQGARRIRNDRLGHGAPRAPPEHAGCRGDRRDAWRRAQSERRSRGDPRAAGGRTARSRPGAKRLASVMEQAQAPVVSNLLKFGRVLRRHGIDVHPGRLLDVIEALGHVNVGSRLDVYHTCRALLVHRHEQLEIFDRAFDAFWQDRDIDVRVGGRPGEPRATVEFQEGLVLPDVSGAEALESDDTTRETGLPSWSDLGVLADKDFAAFTPAELAEGAAALSRLAWSPGERRTRRWVRGPRPANRSATRDLPIASEPKVTWSGSAGERGACDHGRSCCSATSAGRWNATRGMLLHFAYAVTGRHRRVEVFLFSTRLTRITRQLRIGRPDDSLAAVSRAGSGLVGRNAHRWSDQGIPPAMGPPRDERRSGSPAHFRWLGLRRSDRTWRTNRTTPEQLPSSGVAKPAYRHHRLRAADARSSGRAPVCGRLFPAQDAEQSRGPRITLERARLIAAGPLNGHAWTSSARTPSTHPWIACGICSWIRTRSHPAFPGCDRFEPDGEDRYKVTLTVAMAAITGTYQGTVELADKTLHQSYRLVMEGQGRPGFVKGTSVIALAARRSVDGRGRQRRRAYGWPDRTSRPTPHRRRREDDPRQVLRVPASEAGGSRKLKVRS